MYTCTTQANRRQKSRQSSTIPRRAVTSLIFKNENLYTVLRCPKCKKVVFLKDYITPEERQAMRFRCCECGVELEYLDLETTKVEVQL